MTYSEGLEYTKIVSVSADGSETRVVVRDTPVFVVDLERGAVEYRAAGHMWAYPAVCLQGLTGGYILGSSASFDPEIARGLAEAQRAARILELEVELRILKSVEFNVWYLDEPGVGNTDE